jgi:hypothetical protein
VGTLAGAVAAPALTAANASANAVWIAGLAGLSGATNMAQDEFGKYLDSSQELLGTRNTLVQTILEKIAAYHKAPDDAKPAAVQELVAACEFYVLVEAGGGTPNPP